MRRALFTVLCALAVTVTLHPARALGGPVWRSWDAGLREAGTSGRPVLVDVYTGWCGWCRRMDQDVYARADVQDYLARRFVTVKLDAEGGDAAHYQGRAYTSRTLAARFGVTGYPTTLFLSARGTLLRSFPGYLPPQDFLSLLRSVAQADGARPRR